MREKGARLEFECKRRNDNSRPTMVKLPYPDRLRVDESKIVSYLLSRSNGQGKAAFFLASVSGPKPGVSLQKRLRRRRG